MRTFLDLQAAVMTERCDPTVYRDRVKGWLNEALVLMNKRLDPQEAEGTASIPLVAGTRVYDLPTGTQRILGVAIPGELPLVERRLPDLNDFEPGEKGVPDTFVASGGKLIFAPIPDRPLSATVNFVGQATRLVNDTDLSNLPDDREELLVTFAAARVYRSEEDVEMASAWMSDWEMGLQRAEVDDPTDAGPHQVPGMWGLDGYRG